MCIERRQRGVTLIELIVAIVVVAVSVSGVFMVYQNVLQHSSDPLLRKQAIAVAESVLEEIERKAYSGAEYQPAGCWLGTGQTQTQANRRYFKCIDDYNGFATTGIYPMDDTAVSPGLSDYTLRVTISDQSTPCAQSKLIQVAVQTPAGEQVRLASYRCNYAS